MESKRRYHRYENLEEFHAGMWRIVRGDKRKAMIVASADLMRDGEGFLAAMRRAICTWPISCEFNFTSDAVNRIAWLGHAGCCIGVGSTEEATRAGWHTLNPAEQDEANRVAAVALSEWDAGQTGIPPFFEIWG